MSLDDKELLNDLVAESKDHLAEIEPDLLALEGANEVPEELVNRLFRAMHSIKGGFSFLGLATIAGLAHTMETALGRVRDGELAITPDLVDALLKGTDKVNAMLDEPETSEQTSVENEEQLLAPFLPGGATKNAQDGASTAEAKSVDEPFSIEDALAAVAQESAPATTGEASPPPAPKPPVEAPAPQSPKPTAAAPSPHKIAKASGGETIRIKIELLDRLMNLAGEMVLARNQVASALGRRLWDVIEKEPVIRELQKSLGSSGEEFEKDLASILRAFPTSLLETPAIKIASQQIDLVTSELQGSIMKTRLQAVGAVFGKLPRLVRDLTRTLNKSIRLEMSGEEVELDKSIIEMLSDPLVHIIRNSCDHAIATPEERQAVGKPAEGVISVVARHDGGQVLVIISDDGRGIDPEKVKAKAISNGLITPEEGVEMTMQEAQRLIFRPGFSTAAVVSDVSGRGVGMDVVRTNIESLGGSVELNSTPGVGSEFVLKLPLTMAIIHSLLVRVGDRRFAIPQTAVEEFTRIRQKDIAEMVETIGSSAVIRRRGKLLPLLRLSELLDINPLYEDASGKRHPESRTRLTDRRAEATELAGWRKELNVHDGGEKSRNRMERRENLSSAMQIVVLKVNNHRYGLIVDSIEGIEETVVKPLSSYLKNLAFYSGATIMGDGKVTMILDPVGLATEAKMGFDVIDETESQLDEEEKKEREGANGYYESQRLLLFTNGTEEVFAVNIDLIDRIDKISRSSFDTVGEKRFIKRGENSLRVLNLSDYLAVTPPAEEPDNLLVLTPKLVRHPMGIIAHEVIDVIDSTIQIDRSTLTGPGIFSSGIMDGKLVIFIDLYNILEQAEPDLYTNQLEGMSDFGGKRVLLAEDTAFFRTITIKYLKEQGFVVHAVEDGVEALREIESGGKYDLLLTDINMPHMNGFELTRRVRALSGYAATMPIVALTSMALDKDREEGFAAGVNYYELKLDKERLMHVLDELFASARS